MKILIVTYLFKPEMAALAARLYPIVQRLQADGHEVSVATGMPNQPTGVLHKGYEGKMTMTETIDGAKVYRTAYHVTARNKSKVGTLRHYVMMMPALYRSGVRAGKVDVVYVTSPPLFTFVPALALQKRSSAKLVVELRDLWPDELVSVGVAKESSKVVRWMRGLEKKGYARASLVICVTQSFIDTVINRGVSKDKIVLLPNGADVEVFKPVIPDETKLQGLPLGNKFVVMYSGMLGLKYGLDLLLDTAKLLSADPDIVVLIRGEGPKKDDLVARVETEKIGNVVFGGEVPFADIPHFICRADVCISCLPADEYLEKIISVKVFEYLACERPVVAALRGETARVIRESGGGLTVDPGDAEAMAKTILELKADPERRKAMGKSAREYIVENYSRKAIAQRLSDRISELK